MSPFQSRVNTSVQNLTHLAQLGGVKVLTWEGFHGTALDAVVTTREGGVSTGTYKSLNLALHVGDDKAAVLENRRRALLALDAGLDDCVVANQVHGIGVATVGVAERGRGSRSVDDAIEGKDALVTTEPGLVLCVLVADCAPVVLFDPEARVLGCAHAGWRGALGGVIEATIESMSALGAEAARLLVGIGPAIAATRYEVGADVAAAAKGRFGEANAFVRPGRADHWWFDLQGATAAIVRRAGVPDEHVAIASIDTGPPGPFYSARAEGRCGRFALLARIAP
jgi:YfiH family protein